MSEKMREALRMARESLAEFHQIGDVPDVLDVIDEALAQKPAQDADRLRAERDHARAQYNNAIKRIVGIHSLLYPAPVTAADGRRFVFRPKSFDPHEILQELSDRIRALSDALPEQQPAQGEAVAWYDGKNFYGSEEAAICDCADMPNLRAVYYAPPASSVPALPSDPPPWWAASLNRRAAIEAELFDMASGKRALPDAARCRAMALELGVPDEFRARLKYESAPAVPDDVAKDAARYRWLRDESRPIDELFMATRTDRAGTYRVSNEMDDIIDAAMLAAAPGAIPCQ